MESRVKVTANGEGKVIIPAESNEAYGFIRVEQVRFVFDDNGFLRKTKLSALVPGKVDDLKALGWVNGQELPGKIIIKEQLTPFNKKDPSRDVKIAGKTSIVCVKDGKPIYRNTFYKDNTNAQDVLVEHTNSDEIKAAYAEVESADLAEKPAGKPGKAGKANEFSLED